MQPLGLEMVGQPLDVRPIRHMDKAVIQHPGVDLPFTAARPPASPWPLK